MKSLEQLMHEAFNLSLQLAYGEYAPDGTCFTARDHPQFDSCNVWSWCDGLMHKYYEKHASGHCSIAGMISFDVGEFEESVKRDIEAMQKLLAEIGPGKTLDFAEMQRRGYRGAWAGYTPEEDKAHSLAESRQWLAEAQEGLSKAKNEDDRYYYGEQIRGYQKQIVELTA